MNLRMLPCGRPMRVWRPAKMLREEYLFIPAKVRELYLTHLLESLEDHKVR